MKRINKYMFDTEEECCEHYFPLNARGCLTGDTAVVQDPCSEEFAVDYWGAYNQDFLLEHEVGYYPSFSSEENKYCVDGGQAPAYMIRSPDIWKTESRSECCYK